MSSKPQFGTKAFHAQESSCTLSAPAGTAGTAGCPEHNAPEQGRGDAGAGGSCNCPATSPTNGSICNESPTESARDLTRWEQPASAARGAMRANRQER